MRAWRAEGQARTAEAKGLCEHGKLRFSAGVRETAGYVSMALGRLVQACGGGSIYEHDRVKTKCRLRAKHV
jgi:hypothetical protein